ncbi:imidazole glycerol phosphate synthase subunit HisH [Pelagibacterium halotolerans]|uniref:Imidazole glycerol phosphate synthase subunit HisH n=1 Tax=Pelagibacterium halotolerans (strain DSM 22347 / JCM 15775 / CGMCC 1.7692 / B2) TaxID=1082931 RepID=G4R7S5_PELHB|nr:imidazole glycerol phosphate synthase subunit HisH [Pelagibacterium halotolerans]AEQ53335.1 imidazole glycerol phosphate synthase amidotransferase subunit [Pelagibacterium halotolerans B2]QJR17052.1 imidazole glycerol phosphate synthase subunit HisH [Pelagibacterium halotolerans]SEA62744.1 glutamine amidotransferase [Pelagibacterium halotolerans]
MIQTVAIIDYGAGNLKSAQKAFARAAEGTGTEIVVTSDADLVRKADRIVLPGVGAFADCMAGLDAVAGMHEVLTEKVIAGGAPFLGVCVGMQLLASVGREKIETKGLGWIAGAIEKIEPSDPALKVPHMGWNTLSVSRPHALLEGIATGENGLHAYFVHSYHMKAENADEVIATADYGGPITAIVGRDNIFGTQFHPEKSQTLGLALIANFLKWRP